MSDNAIPVTPEELEQYPGVEQVEKPLVLFYCVDCCRFLDQEDGKECPHHGSETVGKRTITLSAVLEKYSIMKRESNKWGEIELNCPSCGELTAVFDIDQCECGARCCAGCRTIGEDCILCPACVKGFEEAAQCK